MARARTSWLGGDVFTRAESDTDHEQVILRTRRRGDITGTALIGVIFAGGAAAVRRRQAR